MNILLDSHLLIWSLNDDPRLSDFARDYIIDPINTIYYSLASIYEIEDKYISHPDRIKVSGKELAFYAKKNGFIPLEIKEEHIFLLDTIHRMEGAPIHKDPFDKLLIAQAKAEGMLFLTHDAMLSYYEENCIVMV